MMKALTGFQTLVVLAVALAAWISFGAAAQEAVAAYCSSLPVG